MSEPEISSENPAPAPADLGLSAKINVQIETINFCNRRCQYCFYGHWDAFPSRIMAMDAYTHILDQVLALPVKINLITHSSYAEPTIDPHFIERLEQIKARRLRYWNITNGTNLTPAILDYLFDNLPLFSSYFLIDVPTVEPDMYRRMTGGSSGQAEKLRDNLHRLGSHIKPKNLTAILMVLGQQDADHRARHAELATEFAHYGYQVTLFPLSDRGGELRPFIDNKIELSCVKGCIDKRLDGNLHFGVGGNMYVCCHDFMQRFSYGNVARTPLEELLRSPGRQRMIDATLAQMCRRCLSAIKC
ncbi:MAG: radical SAM protein [Magnetococcus sp. DMHC-1]|nr:radical SAM protein [Magnetococcales bacterium]